MLIFLKVVTKKTIAVECHSYTLVDELKLHVLDQLGIDINNQILIFKGERMEEFKMLENYGIKKQNTTVLVIEEKNKGELQVEWISRITVMIKNWRERLKR